MNVFGWLIGLWIAPILTLILLYVKFLKWIIVTILKIALAMLKELLNLLVYLAKELHKAIQERRNQ